MFGIFKKKDSTATPARTLEHPKELQKGDLMTFKDRSIVPLELQNQTLTVETIQAYQYDDGLSPEFVVRLPDGKTYTFMCSSDEEGDYIVISKKLTHNQIVSLFDPEQFADVFDEPFSQLSINTDAITDDLSGWTASSYFQTIKGATAYFYKDDRRVLGASDYLDDDSEELIYHEAQGSPDQFSLNVEVWEDGSTDVFLQVSLPINVVAEMWPNG